MSLQPLLQGNVAFTSQALIFIGFYLKKNNNKKHCKNPNQPKKPQPNQNPSCILEENQLDTPNWDEFSMQKNNIKQ